eukprot:Awhi_evm1s6202
MKMESSKYNSLGYSSSFSEVDDQGFVTAFDVSNAQTIDWQRINSFFKNYGFFVVRGAFSENAIAETVDEFWNLKNQESVSAGAGTIIRNDCSTWDDDRYLVYTIVSFTRYSDR